jgi:hypothetical protein
MGSNPYESPIEQLKLVRRTSARRIAVYVVAWCFFFLIPSICVALALTFPNVFGLTQPPAGDNIFSRLSLCTGIRADIALPISFVGCAVTAALSPSSPGWKLAIVVGWFPLFFFVEMLGIILAIQWATGFVCT